MDTNLIDSKIKEKYEKIMGKPMPHIPIRQPGTQIAAKPAPILAPASSATPAHHTLQDTTNRVKPSAPSFYNVKSSVSSEPLQQGSQLYLMIGIGFFIFFVMYILFWIKYFSIALPFKIPFING